MSGLNELYLRKRGDMSKQLAFYMDVSTCMGCKTCQVACKDKHNLPVGVLWRRIIEYAGGSWVSKDEIMVPDNLYAYYIPVSCNHCEKPACVEACPTGAIYKRDEDGLVLVRYSECTNCRTCEDACPYHVPQFHPNLECMTKCTLCDDLLSKGEKPVCVEACPVRALDLGELDDLREKYGKVCSIEPLPVSHITLPSLVLTPHRHAKPSGAGDGSIVNLEGEI